MKTKLFVGLSLGLVIIIFLFYKFNTHKDIEPERQLREQAEKVKKEHLLTDCNNRFQNLLTELENAKTTWFMKQTDRNVADALTIKADRLSSECPQINPDIANLKKRIEANKD